MYITVCITVDMRKNQKKSLLLFCKTVLDEMLYNTFSLEVGDGRLVTDAAAGQVDR